MNETKSSKIDQRELQADNFLLRCEGMNAERAICFLAGYACGSMKLIPNNSNYEEIYRFIKLLFDNANAELITKANVY